MNQVIQGDCLEVMRGMPDCSVDAVVTDPPYGLGIAKWDKPIDPTQFLLEAKRVAKTYVVFFGQFPTVGRWMAAAETVKLHPLEHVTWVKRNDLPIGKNRLTRQHEEILFYASGKVKKFAKVRGRYSDVKWPLLESECLSLEAIKRRMADLERWIETGEQPIRANNNQQQYFGSETRLCYEHKIIRPDVNYSNVWSFSTPKQESGRRYNGEYIHPCEKPISVMSRILAMLGHGLILDPFAGSGSTGVACKGMGYDFILIEQEPEYVAIANARIAAAAARSEKATLEQRVAWLETQVQAQGAKLKRIEASQQLSLWGTP